MRTSYSQQISTLQKFMSKETDVNTYEALNDAASTIAALKSLRITDLSKVCMDRDSGSNLNKFMIFIFGIASGIGSVAFYISIF